MKLDEIHEFSKFESSTTQLDESKVRENVIWILTLFYFVFSKIGERKIMSKLCFQNWFQIQYLKPHSLLFFFVCLFLKIYI